MGQRDDRWESWVAKHIRGRNLHRPSEGSLRKAIALGSQLQPRSGRGWLVELLFDSVAEPLPAGVRAGLSGQRRLLYQVRPDGGPPGQLDLRLRKETTGAIELTGQLLPPETAVRVEVRSGKTRRHKKLGASGEFLFRGVPARVDTIALALETADGETVVLDDVPLGLSDPETS